MFIGHPLDALAVAHRRGSASRMRRVLAATAHTRSPRRPLRCDI